MRTIDSPGVEIKEVDLSLHPVTPVGTNVLVHGFSPQGPTDEVITVSTKTELDEIFFGQKGPTNDAERYFHSSCEEILNSPATLLVTRLPYGSGAGYDIPDEYAALAYPLSAWKLTSEQIQLTALASVCPAYDPNCFTFDLSTNLSALSSDPVLKLGDFSCMAYWPLSDVLVTIGVDPENPTADVRIALHTTDFTHLTTVTGLNFFDTEAVCWLSGSTFALMQERTQFVKQVENTAYIHYFDLDPLTPFIDSVADTTKFNVAIDYVGNSGPEGITFDEVNDRFLFVREGSGTYPACFDPDSIASIGVFTVDVTGGTATELFPTVAKLSANYPDYLARGADLSDCYYRQDTQELYLLSDLASSVFVVDLSGNTLATRGFPLVQAEGITMNVTGNQFFVGGEPAQIMRYSMGDGTLGVTQILSADISDLVKIIPSSLTMTVNHYLSTIYGFDFLSAMSLVDDGVGGLSANSSSVSGWLNYTTAQIYLSSYLENVRTTLSSVFDVSFNYLARSSNLGELNYVETDDPYYVPITETQYFEIKAGEVTWSVNGGVPDSYDNLGNAAFVVVNKAKTIIDEEYQGYYMAITDNSQLEDGTYDSIELIKSINSNSNLITLDTGLLGFPLTGTDASDTDQDSASRTVEQSHSYDFQNSSYNDSIMINLFKINKSLYGRDSSVLYYTPIEHYIASLESIDKRVAADSREAGSFFIEDQVNDHSNYIEVFSNNILSKQIDIDYVRSLNTNLNPVGSYFTRRNESNTLKHIGNLPIKIARALSLVENVQERDIDITIGAGLETVWAYVADENGDKEFNATDNIATSLAGLQDVNLGSSSLFAGYHKTIFNLYNNFCSLTRRDCIHYSDPIRGIFIQGENFRTLDRKDRNFTSNILTPLKNLYGAANSSYSATYANWVSVFDNNTGRFVWAPFSGWQAAITARTDAKFYHWTAPFGLNNGVIPNITSLAFEPSQQQQDALYRSGINPVVFFNRDGYVVWGQKTLQARPSAFDRLNVRKLFVVLERAALKILRYFVGEPNTVYARARVNNVLIPLFELAKNNEGCYDYKIVCDETNNTPDVIDNNEMQVDIYIKPVRTAEFIIVTFYATRTDQDFTELLA